MQRKGESMTQLRRKNQTKKVNAPFIKLRNLIWGL